MTDAELALSELERDALTELVNIGVSRAAASLRKMVGEEVLLSVPAVEVVDRRAAAALISERESGDLVAVKQDFAGAFAGRAMLIFPQSNSLDLVRAVVGEDLAAVDAAEMEQEALAETGNVILNGCLGTMANMLHRSLTMSLPEVMRGDGAKLFNVHGINPDDGLVLFLYINFSVRHRDLRGYIAMLLDLPSLTALKLLIAEFIANVMDDDFNSDPSVPFAKITAEPAT
jgi:chemotaxis protein CheC